MTASFLLLSSAFLHALWNVFIKKSATPAIQLAGVMTCAAIFSLAFIPLFAEPAWLDADSFFWAVGAGLSEGAYMITLALTLERLPIGPSYTIMRGGGMILVWLFAVTMLGEALTPITAMGALLVGLGLFWAGRSPKASLGPEKKPKNFFWAYMSAIFIASYHLCYERALASHANPASLFAIAMWVALPCLLIFTGAARLRTLKQRLRGEMFAFLVGGLIAAVSFLMFLVGLRHSGAGYAYTLRNSSVIFAQLLAFAIGERVYPNQWVGAFLVAAGATIVTL